MIWLSFSRGVISRAPIILDYKNLVRRKKHLTKLQKRASRVVAVDKKETLKNKEFDIIVDKVVDEIGSDEKTGVRFSDKVVMETDRDLIDEDDCGGDCGDLKKEDEENYKLDQITEERKSEKESELEKENECDGSNPEKMNSKVSISDKFEIEQDEHSDYSPEKSKMSDLSEKNSNDSNHW